MGIVFRFDDKQPVAGREARALLCLVGSDRRGTAYAVFTLSQAMGVSPWNWWADVKPRRKDALWVSAGSFLSKGTPSAAEQGTR